MAIKKDSQYQTELNDANAWKQKVKTVQATDDINAEDAGVGGVNVGDKGIAKTNSKVRPLSEDKKQVWRAIAGFTAIGVLGVGLAFLVGGFSNNPHESQGNTGSSNSTSTSDTGSRPDDSSDSGDSSGGEQKPPVVTEMQFSQQQFVQIKNMLFGKDSNNTVEEAVGYAKNGDQVTVYMRGKTFFELEDGNTELDTIYEISELNGAGVEAMTADAVVKMISEQQEKVVAYKKLGDLANAYPTSLGQILEENKDTQISVINNVGIESQASLADTYVNVSSYKKDDKTTVFVKALVNDEINGIGKVEFSETTTGRSPSAGKKYAIAAEGLANSYQYTINIQQ